MYVLDDLFGTAFTSLSHSYYKSYLAGDLLNID